MKHFTILVLATSSICWGFPGLTNGTKVSEAQMQKIKVGKTTHAEVVRMLGEPNVEIDVTQNGYLPKECGPSGSPLKQVSYVFWKGSVGHSQTDIRMIYFNQSKVVCGIGSQKMKT